MLLFLIQKPTDTETKDTKGHQRSPDGIQEWRDAEDRIETDEV